MIISSFGNYKIEESSVPADMVLAALETLRREMAQNKKEICATIDSRIETVTENLKKEFSIMKGDTQTALAAIKATMLAHTEAIKEVEGAATQHSDDITRLQTEVARLTADTAKLSDKCEDLEGRSRRNNICMIGVPEGKEGTRPREFYFAATRRPLIPGSEAADRPLPPISPTASLRRTTASPIHPEASLLSCRGGHSTQSHRLWKPDIPRQANSAIS
ncbi:hypothetical protein KUCAC02_010511 [Chaenocephalus aceratus]|uniref:Uncharacterized protein n=1 Tax=Chaenocephalus aceratus TaxID=36190 RepID=A0ACB9VZ82_CHAAC|nr:hypothetical protein KUCAC02_010511 [Chaenocephalus aceratus]